MCLGSDFRIIIIKIETLYLLHVGYQISLDKSRVLILGPL